MSDPEFRQYHLTRIFKYVEEAVPGTGCMLWKGAVKHPENKYGIFQIKFPGKDSKCLHAHRALFMIYHGISSIERYSDISHLCGNSLCMQISHLSLEPHFVNCQRKTCHEFHVCHGHGDYAKCLLF